MENAPIETLLNLYVKFHSEIKTDPALEDKGRLEFKKLEDGDSENKKLWAWFKEVSLKEFNRLYDRLEIHFDIV